MEQTLQPVVLHIDDDPDDRLLVKTAIKNIDESLTVFNAADGEEGFKCLQQLKAENKLPCLIILDMNMPKLTGQQVVEELKKDKILSKIPIILFTTSLLASETSFFEMHQVEMVTKPSRMNILEKSISRILNYCHYSADDQK